MSNTSSNGKAKAMAKPKLSPPPLTLHDIRKNSSLDTASISSTNSLQNDIDEIRGLIRDSATLYCEASKIQVENMRQISEVLGLIRSLTTAMLQNAIDNQRAKTDMDMKDSKVFSTLPKTPNRVDSRRGQAFSQTQILTPVRSRSVSRLQGVKSYDL